MAEPRTDEERQAEADAQPDTAKDGQEGEHGPKGKGLGSLKSNAAKGDKRRAYIAIALGVVGAVIAYMAYRAQKASAAGTAAAGSAGTGSYTYPAGMGAGTGTVAGSQAGGTAPTLGSLPTVNPGGAMIPAGSSGVSGGIGDQSSGGDATQMGSTPPATVTSFATSAGQATGGAGGAVYQPGLGGPANTAVPTSIGGVAMPMPTGNGSGTSPTAAQVSAASAIPYTNAPGDSSGINWAAIDALSGAGYSTH